MEVFTIRPRWLPMDDAPKDGRTIVLALASACFEKDEISTGTVEVRWGRPSHYPDAEPQWMKAQGDGNSFFMEQDWTRERHLSNEYGQEREITLYRGMSFLGWAEPWTVEVEMAEATLPFRQDVIFDSRAK